MWKKNWQDDNKPQAEPHETGHNMLKHLKSNKFKTYLKILQIWFQICNKLSSNEAEPSFKLTTKLSHQFLALNWMAFSSNA